MESTEVIAKRIENAVNVLGMERIKGFIRIAVFGCCRVVWPIEKWPYSSLDVMPTSVVKRNSLVYQAIAAKNALNQLYPPS